MNKRVLYLAALLLAFSSIPAFGVSKEIVELQTQVQNLQAQMTQMKQSFDEHMGEMKNLIEQSTDNVNKMSTAVDTLQKNLTQQNTDNGGKLDQVSGQVQALHDSLDELKARVAKLSKQIDDMNATHQNLPTTPTTPQAQAPPADVLYNNALRDYNAGRYDLASQEFADYMKFYSDTELAGNAQFYVADIEYRQGNYQQAVTDYDKVLEQYAGGNKTAAAQLKKGFALLELGQKQEGIKELNALVQRYPRSIEASQARDRLRKLGAAPAASRKPSPSRVR
ncbi:MAG TPA: tetratricopeptide repeat protein [Terriglobales bacterium]|nr:tetratricopeptide repeat protein [Terriglobales bacterium]